MMAASVWARPPSPCLHCITSDGRAIAEIPTARTHVDFSLPGNRVTRHQPSVAASERIARARATVGGGRRIPREGRALLLEGNQSLPLCGRHRTARRRGGISSDDCRRITCAGRAGTPAQSSGRRAASLRGRRSARIAALESHGSSRNDCLFDSSRSGSKLLRQAWGHAPPSRGTDALRRRGTRTARARSGSAAEKRERFHASYAGHSEHWSWRKRVPSRPCGAGADHRAALDRRNSHVLN